MILKTFLILFLIIFTNTITWSLSDDDNKQGNQSSSIIRLSTGEKIKIPNYFEINDDWKNGFEENLSELQDKKIINEYLDGTRGYSIYEKGYWISLYNKTKHIKLLTQKKRKYQLVYQLYYLQRIFFDTQIGYKLNITNKISEIKRKLSPSILRNKDLHIIQLASSHSFITNHKRLNQYYSLLIHTEQKSIANYILQLKVASRDKILSLYSNKLDELHTALKDLDDFTTKKINIPSLRNEKLNLINKLIRESENIFQLLINMSYIYNDDILLNQVVKQKKDYQDTVEKKYQNLLRSSNQ